MLSTPGKMRRMPVVGTTAVLQRRHASHVMFAVRLTVSEVMYVGFSLGQQA